MEAREMKLVERNGKKKSSQKDDVDGGNYAWPSEQRVEMGEKLAMRLESRRAEVLTVWLRCINSLVEMAATSIKIIKKRTKPFKSVLSSSSTPHCIYWHSLASHPLKLSSPNKKNLLPR